MLLCTSVVVSAECRIFLPSPLAVAHTEMSHPAGHVGPAHVVTLSVCCAMVFFGFRPFLCLDDPCQHSSSPAHTHTHALSNPNATSFSKRRLAMRSGLSSITSLHCVSFPTVTAVLQVSKLWSIHVWADCPADSDGHRVFCVRCLAHLAPFELREGCLFLAITYSVFMLTPIAMCVGLRTIG